MVLDRRAVDKADVAKQVGQAKTEEIERLAQQSAGVNFNDEDLRQCRVLAAAILSLHGLREQYETYQQKLAQEICPNVAHVAGADIAAQLIAHVGPLERLAKMPASTIQVVGAEKALFKHLRNRRIAPPKHGILFQYPRISGSPKRIRGKIARALANKIALACRADYFSKRFIAEALKKDLDARLTEIFQEYQKGKP